MSNDDQNNPLELSQASFLNDLQNENIDFHELPENGKPPAIVKKILDNKRILDFSPELNTSSYVQVDFEPMENDVLVASSTINLADQTIYPHAYKIHNESVNMIARLWHCPEPVYWLVLL